MSGLIELTNTELDAVCGGGGGHHKEPKKFTPAIVQTNVVTEVALNIDSWGGPQTISQGNNSLSNSVSF